MREKVLIFGASGLAGSYLAQEFLNCGYEVYSTDRIEGEMLPKEVKHSLSDLMDSIAVAGLINDIKPDKIVNLAGISSVAVSWDKPQTTVEFNIVGALNIMEAVRKSQKETKVLFIGSSEEYAISDFPMNEERPLDASNPYGISKVTQESFAKMYREQYGLQIYFVRAFNHTGVGQRDSFVLPSWCRQVAEVEKSGKPGIIKVGNITVKRDFSHVKDIVRAYRMIIESDNCNIVYNVGNGKAYSLKEMLEYIISLSSQKIDVQVDPSRIRPTDQPIVCCDYSLIKTQLGWEPQYTVFDALKEMFEFYTLLKN